MNYKFLIFILLFLSCTKGSRETNNNGIEVNLIELEIISCNTISASFDLRIDGDSTQINNYGVSYTYPGSPANFRIERDYPHQLYKFIFSDLIPFQEYTFTPYVTINGTKTEGPFIVLSSGGLMIDIDSEEKFDLTNTNLDFDFISESAGARIINKAYVIGGASGSTPSSTSNAPSDIAIEIDLESGNHKVLSPFPRKSIAMNAFVHNNELYCGLGASSFDGSILYNDIKKYSFVDNEWINFSEIPNKEGFAGGYSFVINDILYVGGGTTVNGISKSFYSFNFTTNEWKTIDDSPREISAGPSFVIGNDFYVGGSGRLEIYKYNTQNETWSTVSPLKVGTTDPICFSRNGKGYIHSGHGQGRSSFQTYDPDNNLWTEECIIDDFLITDEAVVFDNGNNLAFGFGSISKVYSIKI